MSLWRQLKHGIRVLTSRRAADRDLDDEVRHYEEELTVAFESKGMSTEEARRAARIEMGTALTVRERVRDFGWDMEGSRAGEALPP